MEPFQLQRTGLPGKVFPVSPGEFFSTLPGGLQLNYDLLRWFKLFEHLIFKEFTVAVQIISEQLFRVQKEGFDIGKTELDVIVIVIVTVSNFYILENSTVSYHHLFSLFSTLKILM